MLDQVEITHLINVLKMLVRTDHIEIPGHGEASKLEVTSQDGKEKFLIDLNRKGIIVSKYSLQQRYRTKVPLIRLDMGPHTNPDGKRFDGPHLHMYTEEYEMRMAIGIPKDIFSNLPCIETTLIEFLEYCKVINARGIPITRGWVGDYPE